MVSLEAVKNHGSLEFTLLTVDALDRHRDDFFLIEGDEDRLKVGSPVFTLMSLPPPLLFIIICALGDRFGVNYEDSCRQSESSSSNSQNLMNMLMDIWTRETRQRGREDATLT